jgi:hypothetical protein
MCYYFSWFREDKQEIWYHSMKWRKHHLNLTAISVMVDRSKVTEVLLLKRWSHRFSYFHNAHYCKQAQWNPNDSIEDAWYNLPLRPKAKFFPFFIGFGHPSFLDSIILSSEIRAQNFILTSSRACTVGLRVIHRIHCRKCEGDLHQLNKKWKFYVLQLYISIYNNTFTVRI